jgi:DNA invertase Pin-like site-specific DNA recombinase
MRLALPLQLKKAQRRNIFMPKSKYQKIHREAELFGYVRVSMKDQNVDRQLIALEPFGIPPQNIYIDKKSGKNFERPRYKSLLRKLRAGDLLYIKSIDRLGRDYAEIIEQWRYLTREKGVDIKVLDMPMLDTTYCKDLLGTFIADLVLQVLSFAAQLERENLLQRQAEGIAAAKAKGVVFGRQAVDVPDNFSEIFQQWRDKNLSNEQAVKLCGFSVRSLYRLTAEWRRDEFVAK